MRLGLTSVFRLNNLCFTSVSVLSYLQMTSDFVSASVTSIIITGV
jgi:hypothetical protein